MSEQDTGSARPGLPAVLRSYRYKPRRIEFQGWRTAGRWRLKTTVVTVRGAARHFAEEVEAAQTQADALLDGLPADGADAGVASLIVHVGRAGVWLLLDWWQEGDILMHRHFFAPLDNPTRFADVAARHLGPCVWELAVQAHEREAWLRHVLANPRGPDLDAYLQDGLTAEL
jgi:hypothetical protein